MQRKRAARSVHGILRHGFNRCACRICLIQPICITSDDIADALPRRCKIPFDEQRIDFLPRLSQHTWRNTEIEQDNTDEIRPPRHGQRTRCQKEPLRSRIGYTEHEQRQERAHGKFSLIASIGRIEHPL